MIVSESMDSAVDITSINDEKMEYALPLVDASAAYDCMVKIWEIKAFEERKFSVM